MKEKLSYEQQLSQSKQLATARILALVPALREAGYIALFGFFDGSGDEGNFEGFRAIKADNVDFDRSTRSVWEMGDIKQEEQEFINKLQSSNGLSGDDFFQLTPDGFEIDDGGFGAVVLFVGDNEEPDKIRLNYSYRVSDTADADGDIY